MELTDNEKALINMIDSCFTYGGANKDNYNFSRYILPYQKDISEKRFYKIYEKRLEYLKDAKVFIGTSTDFEGLTYNSLELPLTEFTL